jgi:putative colanic acid biosynthesis acetyltransferase WcaF
MRLDTYKNPNFDRGRHWLIEALWLLVDSIFVRSWLPGTEHRRIILRAFGAKIGDGVVLKPRIKIKFPWRLEIGNYSWVGEDVWIDNLALVKIGANCCISQAAYICTGNHDWSSHSFELSVNPVLIGDGVWLAARTIVGPGVSIGEGVVLTLGSVALSNLSAFGIYQGAPAKFVKARRTEGLSRDGQERDMGPQLASIGKAKL